jgi:hypothetical protein
MRLLMLGFLGACSAVQTPVLPEPSPDHVREASGITLTSRADLCVLIQAPKSARYDAQAFGVAPPLVHVKLTNVGKQPIETGDIAVTFDARRSGVTFPCSAKRVTDRRPTITPNASVTFDDPIDCTFSLPGRYDVSVFLSVGDGPREFIESFPFDVGESPEAPQPYPPHMGLFVLAVGNRATPPLTPDAWARGDYHVAVAVINGSPEPQPVGPARVSFTVYKVGSPLPCAGESQALSFPEALAPGAMQVVRTPITCAPSEEGRYEVVARFTLAGPAHEMTAGRFALRVSRNPLLFAPDPLPLFMPPI